MADFFNALAGEIAGKIPELGGRVYPTAAPEGAGTPHCVYMLLEKEDILALDGPTGLAKYSVQLHIVVKRYAEANSLSDKIKAVLIDMPKRLENCLDVNWTEPAPEGYEPGWDVQRRSPVVNVLYYDN